MAVLERLGTSGSVLVQSGGEDQECGRSCNCFFVCCLHAKMAAITFNKINNIETFLHGLFLIYSAYNALYARALCNSM
jgi:hypothetical protein